MPVDFQAARQLLDRTFADVEQELLQGKHPPDVSEGFKVPCDIVFQSKTQAYRECILGCTVARIQDRSINIRQPYVGHGPHAFNGRTLDEKVINPFLHDRRIPASKGPFLSTFRRSVEFNEATGKGVQDKKRYPQFLQCLTFLESTKKDSELLRCLRYILHKFLVLREESNVPLTRVQRFSLDQYDSLISALLRTPSGGRFPLFLVVATFQAIRDTFGLNWEVSWQGINVADSPSGAVGDVTIAADGKIVLAAEITERVVDRSRVVTTFNTKIAPSGIEDYLFVVNPPGPDSDAKKQAHQYFAQGHEVSFVEIKNWITMLLATIGKRGRNSFNQHMLRLLDDPGVPKALKVAWNDNVSLLVSSDE